MVANPKEFCEAMRELAMRSQRHPATAVSDQAHEMKLRVLDFFIAGGIGDERVQPPGGC